MMETPRCGFPDILPMRTEDSKWRKSSLTYTVINYVPGLSKKDQDLIFEESFNSISAVCNLKFTRILGNTADIIIDVGQGIRDNFDGPSGTLAWCEIPQSNNNPVHLKFDRDEKWIKHPATNGIRLPNVSCHEKLHGCNLLHNNVPNSLMNPYYNINIWAPQAEEKRQLVSMYGPPISIPPVAPPVVPPTVPPVVPPSTLNIQIKGSIEDIQIEGYRIMKMS